MSINLALVLTLLTALTGIVYLLDIFVWHDSKRGSDEPRRGRQTLVEYSRSFFPVLLIVLVIVLVMVWIVLMIFVKCWAASAAHQRAIADFHQRQILQQLPRFFLAGDFRL